MKNNWNKKKVLIIIVATILILAIITGIIIFTVSKSNNNENKNGNELANVGGQENLDGEKVDIIDINSKTRPYAVAVNNTAVAVKVQEGLNKAYLVYEIPTEGNTSRVLALYKDIEEDLDVGTVRSARHNFIDFALESDAILCCFGWSHYAENDMKRGSIDYIRFIWRSIL